MLIIKIITVGRVKEKWLDEAIKEYEKRLSGRLKIIWQITKNTQELSILCSKEKKYFCFDILGKSFSSEDFHKKIFSLFTIYGNTLTFVIGGAEGLSKDIKDKAIELFSLSKLTFTHQMTRIILLEQLYRALEIEQNSQYHK